MLSPSTNTYEDIHSFNQLLNSVVGEAGAQGNAQHQQRPRATAVLVLKNFFPNRRCTPYQNRTTIVRNRTPYIRTKVLND